MTRRHGDTSEQESKNAPNETAVHFKNKIKIVLELALDFLKLSIESEPKFELKGKFEK